MHLHDIKAISPVSLYQRNSLDVMKVALCLNFGTLDEVWHTKGPNLMLGPLCYKLITIVNCYLEAGLTCFVYCPKALYLIIFIVWHPF